MKPARTRLGVAIRELRYRLEMSGPALADFIGIEPPNISFYESGRTVPSRPAFRAICSLATEAERTELVSARAEVDPNRTVEVKRSLAVAPISGTQMKPRVRIWQHDDGSRHFVGYLGNYYHLLGDVRTTSPYLAWLILRDKLRRIA